MNEKIKVYQTSECDWTATPLSLDETIKWYEREFGVKILDYEEIEEIKEVDIDTHFVWSEVEEDTPLYEKFEDKRTSGDVISHGGRKFKLITFRDEINSYNHEIETPYIISCTEF